MRSGIVSRRLPSLFITAVLSAAACTGTATVPESNPTNPPSTTGSTEDETAAKPSGPAALEASPAPTVHGDRLTSDASVSYDGFRVWAGQSAGVAVVRVVEVGPVRWNSASGDRPPEAALHDAPRGHRDAYNSGRLIVVERVRLVAGRWPANGSTVAYWRPGGSLGGDTFEPPLPMPDVTVGAEAVALLVEADAGADGPIPVQVGWLFPADATGRVATLDPAENITLGTIESFLP